MNYRGDLGVILINLSKTPFVIQPGERVAQVVLCKVDKVKWIPVSTLPESDRGEGGFGSTGK